MNKTNLSLSSRCVRYSATVITGFAHALVISQLQWLITAKLSPDSTAMKRIADSVSVDHIAVPTHEQNTK
jgi:hypothetical protein